MVANMIAVLYICSEYSLDGAAQSLLNMIASVKDKVKPIILCYEGAVYEYFKNQGIECYVAPHLLVYSGDRGNWSHFVLHPWHLRIVKQFRIKWFFIKIARKNLSDKNICLVHTNVSATTFGVFVSKILKVKHIWHVRECLEEGSYWDGKLFIGRKRLKHLINKADARIAVSNSCRQFWGLNEKNTWTLLDAIRSVNDCCYEKEKQPYFLFCSYWVNEAKGASRAVEAFGKSGLFIPSSEFDATIRLKIVGACSDGYKKELLALAESYGCSDYVDFVPVQEDVKTYFTNAMAFIQPSLNEGLGRATCEAMFFGCPIIAYASGGTLDLVKDGETGYLFNTVDECAELMKKVCAANQEEIIFRAQEFARQNLSVENYRKKIMEVYNTVLKSK